MAEEVEVSAPAPAAAPTAAAVPQNPVFDDQNNRLPEPDEAQKAFIKGWMGRIAAGKRHWETTFARMRKCMEIAKAGADSSWAKLNEEGGNYVVPIINRHINQSVAQTYAKNPKAYCERKRRRMYAVWDGKLASLYEAIETVQTAIQVGMPPDPNAMAIINDVAQVQAYNNMMDGMAETLEILHDYFINEQSAGYKQQFKAAVRRARVNGIAYVDLQFQRLLEPRPDVTAEIRDMTAQVATVEARLRQMARGEIEEDEAKFEELRLALAELQKDEYKIVREGPVYAFPKSTQVILDPEVKHIKTLAGADWWALEFEMTPDRIEATYKININGRYQQYKPDGGQKTYWSDYKKKECSDAPARVYRVQQKSTGLEFTICEGCDYYLKKPQCPDVRIERFFTLFPIVFNEVEDENGDSIPPSDVWNARHSQQEYNRSRQGLREHRHMNRPGYYSPAQSLQETDKQKLQNRALGDIVEVGALTQGEKLVDKLAPIPTVPLDPNLYEVESLYNDMLRTVGSQQANMGSTAGDTATESSIAENSRQVGEASNVDDLDDVLAELAHATGQLMLTELSKDTVIEIVGPGAVWPDTPMTREEAAKDLALSIKAGSSGRPNKPAELANMERAMPFVTQLPNVNPTPFAEKFCGLLDVDVKGAVVEGMPSIQAINAMMAKAQQLSAQNASKNPAEQGGKGGDNAPKPAANEPGAQPAYPAPQGAPGAGMGLA
jgi:hypothetical protein